MKKLLVLFCVVLIVALLSLLYWYFTADTQGRPVPMAALNPESKK